MKNLIILLLFICSTFQMDAQNLPNNSANISDLKKMISSDLKSLRIAKNKRDTVKSDIILEQISMNQKLLDTLIVAQIGEYKEISDLYINNLNSQDSLKVYENNQLHFELYKRLFKTENISTLKEKEPKSLELSHSESFLKNDSGQTNLEITMTNGTVNYVRCRVIISDRKNRIILSKFINLLPYEIVNPFILSELKYIQAHKKIRLDYTFLYQLSSANFSYNDLPAVELIIEQDKVLKHACEVQISNKHRRVASKKLIKDFKE